MPIIVYRIILPSVQIQVLGNLWRLNIRQPFAIAVEAGLGM